MTQQTDRQTGRTSEQLATAPPGALFIWCNGHLDYPRALALKLGRDDLRVLSPETPMSALRGVARWVVVDHAARLKPQLAYEVAEHNMRLTPAPITPPTKKD